MTLLAGYSDRVITPSSGLELTGFGYFLDRRGEAVRDDLHVRVIALAQGDMQALLISCDLLGLSLAHADAIRGALADECEMAPEAIVLACTHTHTGPASQPLLGMGEVEPAYLVWLQSAMREAVHDALGDLREATFASCVETVEPIGINRRTGDFTTIDPTLKLGVFTRDDGQIYLLNYACHPVTFGPARQYSADWPGAVCRALETRGHRAVVFQGFCGDINPVNNLEHHEQAADEVVEYYGEMLARRALISRQFAEPREVTLTAAERRIRLPLIVPTADEITEIVHDWLRRNGKFGGGRRFIAEWQERAQAAREVAAARPWLPDVPVQVLSLGETQCVALPGEAFSGYSQHLRARHPALFTFGYANGNVGYFPTREAYCDPSDYACYCAPFFYTLFSFSPEIEWLVLNTAESLLRATDQHTRPAELASL